MVEDIPVFGKAALFAGRHRNEGLGRLVVGRRGSSAAVERADDRGCPLDDEEGNTVGLRSPSVGTGREAHEKRLRHGTCPSLGPETRARSLFARRALSEASRLGKPAQAGRTSTGVVESGRRAARRTSPLRKERRGASEKEGGRGHRPCEDQGARVWLPARRMKRNCRSRQAASGLE
jgi:hypothetical protein